MRGCSGLVLAVVAGVLPACGGGGGEDRVPPTPFVSFSAVQSGQTVEASGVSRTVTATTDLRGTVLSRIVNAVDTDNSSVQMSFGAGPALNAFNVKTPQSSPSWSGSEIVCNSSVCTLANAGFRTRGATVNALGTIGWNYQTFGFWLSEGPLDSAGAISIGNPTPVIGTHIFVTATYTGTLGGIYIKAIDSTNATGAVFEYAAVMTAVVNLTAPPSIAFSTSGTKIGPVGGTLDTPMPDLNLSGNLTLTTVENRFSGNISTAAGSAIQLNGGVTGRFYGPNADEISGVFALTGGGVQTVLAGFGGKKP